MITKRTIHDAAARSMSDGRLARSSTRAVARLGAGHGCTGLRATKVSVSNRFLRILNSSSSVPRVARQRVDAGEVDEQRAGRERVAREARSRRRCCARRAGSRSRRR